MTAPQRGTAPTISLVVVNHRSALLTERLVDAVAGEVDEVVIVDNPADEDPGRREVTALDAVAARHGNVLVVPLPRNVGYGSGANAGAAATHGDVLVVANPDVQVDAPSLRILAARAHRAGVAGPRFERPDGTLERSAHRREPGVGISLYDLCPPVSGLLRRIRPGWHPTLFASADHDRPLTCSHLLGALLAVDAAAFRTVGGFDEAFFLYREETDLCRRLRDAGWRVRYEPAARAVHIGGGSTDDPWPMPARPVVLESHYRYIAKHRGRAVAGLARSVGTLGSLLWLARLRDRRAALRSLRWHLGARRTAPMPKAPVASGEPGPVTVALSGLDRVRGSAARRFAATSRPWWRRLGLHILAVRYDDPVPDASAFGRTEQGEAAGIEVREDQQLALLERLQQFADEYRHLPARPTGTSWEYHLENPSFGPVDAEVLYSMVRLHRPGRVLEIGSGMSTRLIAAALTRNHADGAPEATFVAADPYPGTVTAGGMPGLTELRRVVAQALPHETFDQLSTGDLLFIDSSHVAKAGSDVVRLVLDVLPRLPVGVLVHVHDIYLPWGYPRSMFDQGWYWNEQYLVQAFLAFNPTYEVLWMSQLLYRRHRDRLVAAFPSTPGAGDGPCSLWLRRVARPVDGPAS